MNQFEQDILTRYHEKSAGLMDSLSGLIGNNGSLNTPLTALGGAALGGMAGHGLGMGGLGVGLGAALGGALGGIGANAINSQNMYQNMNDAAMINGISAGLNANDQTDMMQNQAIAQTNDTVNQLVGMVGDMMQSGMGMGGGMMPPEDPGMMAGQPPMDPGMMPPEDPGMMPPPPPSNPMSGQIDNNGLGMKQGSYNESLLAKLRMKLAEAGITGDDEESDYEDSDLEGLDDSSEEDIADALEGNSMADIAEDSEVSPEELMEIVQALTDENEGNDADVVELAQALAGEE